MTDPSDTGDVARALLAWAQRTYGGTTSIGSGPWAIEALDVSLERKLYPDAARGVSAQREAEVLRFVTTAGYGAPRPVEASATTDDFGVPYVVMEQVPGRTVLDRVSARPRQAPALIDALASAHARLHQLDTAAWPFAVDPGVTWRRGRARRCATTTSTR